MTTVFKELIFSPHAFLKMVNHAASSIKKEIGGLLIGTFDKTSLFIADVENINQKGTSTHVTFSDLEMARVAEKLERWNLKETIIGWYHTHPGMGAHFFSQTDVNTQKRYQSLFEDAIGIVLDPAKYHRSGDLTLLDIFFWRLDGTRALKEKFVFTKAFFKSIERIIDIRELIKELSPRSSEIRNQFEEFLREDLDRKIIFNYRTCSYRINYQISQKRMFAHWYFKRQHRMSPNTLVLKLNLQGRVRYWNDKLKEENRAYKIVKDKNSRFHLITFNTHKLELTAALKRNIIELYESWKSQYNLG